MLHSHSAEAIHAFHTDIAHGLADYLVGMIVIAMPSYFGWTGNARFFFVPLGVAVIGYSLLTDYELGLFRIVRIPFHLALDAFFGVAMLLAPALLHLPANGSVVVCAIGAYSILLSFTTKIHPKIDTGATPSSK